MTGDLTWTWALWLGKSLYFPPKNKSSDQLVIYAYDYTGMISAAFDTESERDSLVNA